MTTSIVSTDRMLTASDIGTTVEKPDSILFQRRDKTLRIIYEQGMLRLFILDDKGEDKINRDFCSVGLNQQEWTPKKTTTFDTEDIPAAIDVLKQKKYISELFAEKVLKRHS